MDIDEALRWGPWALAAAGVALAVGGVAAHISLARIGVGLRSRRARAALAPVVAPEDAPPDAVVVIEGLLALPPRSALRDRADAPPEAERPVVETANRRVRLDGPVRVTAGSVETSARRSATRSIMRGARVRARGRLAVERSGEADAYRAEGAVWSLVPVGDVIEVAALETKRVREHRWGLSAVIALALAALPVALATWNGARVFAKVGAPTVVLAAIEGDAARWRRVWSAQDRNRLAVASLSPLLRKKVRTQREREDELRTAFPPMNAAEAERVAALLRANGDCVHESELLLRTGRVDEALAAARACAATEARAVEREALCVRDPSAPEGCALSYVADDAGRARWAAVFAARAGRRSATNGEGSVRADESLTVDASVDAVGCAFVTALRDPAAPPGATVRPLPAGAWDDMLSHDAVACRALAATRATRRDAAALGSLVDAQSRSVEARWRALLAHARSYVFLTGADAGRITAPVCAARALPAELDAAWLSRHPALALAFLRAGAASSCAWVGDRVYFPAAEALARFLSAAAVPDDAIACGGGRCEGALDARGWMWQVDAIRAHRTAARFWATALRRLDARYTPRRLDEFEAGAHRLLAGLPRYAMTGLDAGFARDGRWPGGFSWSTVTLAMGALRAPSAWSLGAFPANRGLHGYQMDRGAVWSSPEARSQERDPLLAALVDFWRTGTWAPSRDAPALYRSERMRRAAEATTAWNAEDVLRVIGPPDEEGVEIMAAVAYRLTGRRASAEHWVRSGIGYTLPSSRGAAAQVLHLARVVTAARRLQLPEVAAEAERARAAALDAVMTRDPWVGAVLDTARDAAR